jgi:hypothetical protein
MLNGKPGGKNVTPASCNAKPPDAVWGSDLVNIDDPASCVLTWDDFCAVSAKMP